MRTEYLINGGYYTAEQAVTILGFTAIGLIGVVTLIGYLMYRWSK